MKKINFLIYIFIFLLASSCEDYLDKADFASIPEEDVFTDYESYQGFMDDVFNQMADYEQYTHIPDWDWGDDMTNNTGWTLNGLFDSGNWLNFANNTDNGQNIFRSQDVNKDAGTYDGARASAGIWDQSWYGIRKANIGLSKLNLFKGSQSERDVLQGQGLFFRGKMHFDILKWWGGIPYIDTVLAPNSNMKLARLTYWETSERIASDLQKAANLLPVNWDEHPAGSATIGINNFLPTKGAAYGILSKVYLYAGSPLMNGTETGNYEYNEDYCKKAVDAAWEVIELSNQGRYNLLPWEQYYENFYVLKDDIMPGGTELIFEELNVNGRNAIRGFTLQGPRRIGWNPRCLVPTQNHVDAYEMVATGLPITDPASGYDPMDPWSGRDPRFEKNIVIDGDLMVVRDDIKAQLYVGGQERGDQESVTGYVSQKFYDVTVNRIDRGDRNFTVILPQLRLAEIYLIFAEAANEAYGPTTVVPNTNLSAVDAVNIVRNRVGMPDVDSKFLGSKEDFRERIRNERRIELAFESHRYYDIRRWHIAHLPEIKEKKGLNFDKDHTFFQPFIYNTAVFEQKHYWLPFPQDQVFLYEAFKQNPGW